MDKDFNDMGNNIKNNMENEPDDMEKPDIPDMNDNENVNDSENGAEAPHMDAGASAGSGNYSDSYSGNYSNNFGGPFVYGVPPYPQQPYKKKRNWKKIALIAGIVAVILVVSAVLAALVVSAVLAAVVSGSGSGSDANYGGGLPYVGALYVEGQIASSSSSSDTYQQSWLIRQINYMMNDESNEGIMLYVNSPGGSVYASDELYLKLEEYKEKTERPLYAYFAETAASGGYYIAAGADKITANRNCTTGSIGVYLGPIINAGDLFDKVGIDVEIIRSGANKAMGNNYEPLTDEQRAIYQQYVNESYEQFVGIVAKGRNMSVDKVKQIADGRIYTAAQAKSNGLIDEVSSFEEAKQAMLAENKLVGKCEFATVRYTPKTDWYSLLMQKSSEQKSSADTEISTAVGILEGDYAPELMYLMQ